MLPEHQRAREALHKLWTEACNQPGYNKAAWTELDRAIADLATIADYYEKISKNDRRQA